MACLDANIVAQYFDLELKPAETDQLFSHIDTCAGCARLFMDAVVARKAGTSVDPDGHTAPDRPRNAVPDRRRDAVPALGPKLGRYEIERILGMGGMGVVYAARDPDLDRKVAIKLLRPDSRISAATLRTRLGREAQAMARLSHPNVINVFEIGTHGEQVFVVMELIDGMTLAEWLRETPRTWREIVQTFVAAGEGLAAAHKAGVVHRDFKPDNVLISREGRVCVTDFGLARIAKSSSDPAETPSSPVTDTTMTYSGLLAGTPAYMAPEQMRGETTDARCDLFSFCVSLYETLYGVRPYSGKNLDELRAAAEAGRLEPPRRAFGPGEYRRAIERGLRARPEDRPASMGELLSELRADPIARRRRRVGALAVALVVIAVALAFFQLRRRTLMCVGAEARLAGVWDPGRKQKIHLAFAGSGVPYAETTWNTVDKTLDRFARDWVTMRTEACEATRLRGEQSEEVLDLRSICLTDHLRELAVLTHALSDGVDGKTIDRAVSAALSLSPLDECANAKALRARVRLPADPAQRARSERLKQQLAEIENLRSLGRSAVAVGQLDGVLEEARALDYPPLVAEALLGGALVHLDLDDGPWEEQFHQAASEAIRGGDARRAADAWDNLARRLASDPKRVEEARRLARYSRSEVAIFGGDSLLEAMQLTTLGSIADTEHKNEEAASLYARAAAAFEGMGDVVRQATELSHQGDSLSEAGKLDEARALCARALQLLEANLGPGHPKLISPMYCLAEISHQKLDYADALARYREALAIDEARRGGLWAAIDLENIGDLLVLLGRPEEALQVFRRAQALCETVGEAAGRHQLINLGGQARSLIALGRSREALPLIERIEPIGRTDPDVVGELDFLHARALWDTGDDHARALRLASDALLELHRLPPSPYNHRVIEEVEKWLAKRR